MRVRGAIALASCALALAGCGSGGGSAPRRLDSAKVQRAIADSILSQRHLHASVLCPRVLAEAKGLIFGCLAQLPDGQTPFAVRETDAAGGVTYLGCSGSLARCAGVGRGAILDTARVQFAIAISIGVKRHLRASVLCPTGVPQREGFRFVCLARYASGSTPFEVTETDGAGHVSYLGL